jgi:Uma2 family endonuclease
MSELLITLTDSTKAEELARFLEHLNYVASVQVIEESDLASSIQEEPKPPFYTPKSSYTLHDIQVIADKFPSDKQWTYSEALQVFPPDLKIKLEILNNKLLIMGAPSIAHQKISNRLSNRLTNFVEEKDLGDILVAPTDVKFDENNVEQPDILFIAVKRSYILEKNVVNGAPDLVVEIISPSNKTKEQNEKKALYESAGVLEYWTIFPKKRQVKVEVLEEGKYKVFSEASKKGSIQSSVLSGFEINLQELMPEKFFEQEKPSAKKTNNNNE